MLVTEGGNHVVFSKIPFRKKIKIAAYIAVILIVSIYIVSAYITTVTGAKEKFTGDNPGTPVTGSRRRNPCGKFNRIQYRSARK